MTQDWYQPVLECAVNQLSLFGVVVFLVEEVFGAAIFDCIDEKEEKSMKGIFTQFIAKQQDPKGLLSDMDLSSQCAGRSMRLPDSFTTMENCAHFAHLQLEALRGRNHAAESAKMFQNSSTFFSIGQ